MLKAAIASVISFSLAMTAGPTGAHATSMALTQTGYDAHGLRLLSDLVTFDVVDPRTGATERRELKYTTPEGFADRPAGSVNLWFVFHGGNGSTDSMNRYFEHIPATSPTVVVFPEALPLGIDGKTAWRNVTFPGEETLRESYIDLVFVEQLLDALLGSNPQLSPQHVYASGFSSGGSMTWMLLCYRSSLFQGFAFYAKQQLPGRRDGGCGDGHALDEHGEPTVVTGYERLTGRVPDLYGRNATGDVAPTTAVLYQHGTFDQNLEYSGAPGCWDALACPPDEDPNHSMAGPGPMQDDDDRLTVAWLLDRHGLRDQAKQRTVPDEDPAHGDDVVTTIEHLYKKPLTGRAAAEMPGANGEHVVWLEVRRHTHAVSALDHHSDVCENLTGVGDPQTPCNENPNASKDFDSSIATLRFFETYARMLRA